MTHPDLVDRRLRLALEADSYRYHALEDAFEYDVRRYTGLTRTGWLVARFTWDDVMHRPAYVRAVLLSLVELRAQQRAVGCPGGSGPACPVA